jgi:hypothetical protein
MLIAFEWLWQSNSRHAVLTKADIALDVLTENLE